MKSTLKEEIDEMFAKRYRLKRDSNVETTPSQEELNQLTGNWQACITNEQHILRFLMQWLLVASPGARQHALDLYGSLLRDRYLATLPQPFS
jgi:hypothetical protein